MLDANMSQIVSRAQQEEAMKQQTFMMVAAGIYQGLAVADYQRAMTELEDEQHEWKMGSGEGEEPKQLKLNPGTIDVALHYASVFMQKVSGQ